jgi:hypothetical protein
VPNQVLDAPAVVAFARLVIIGGRGDRLHEELIAAGGKLRRGKFEAEHPEEVRLWQDAAGTAEPSSQVKQNFTAVWPQVSAALRRELDSCAKAVARSVDSKLDHRAAEEKTKIRAILSELERSISNELDDPWWKQLTLLDQTELERRQLEDSIDSLRARVLQIPTEIERETVAIDERFDRKRRQTHLFPVAVTWLVPARLGKG